MFDFPFILGIGGGVGVFGAALALGLRHGIDWDHIAAITDITSASTAAAGEEEEGWLLGEPGVMLTDESHHHSHSHSAGQEHEEAGGGSSLYPHAHGGNGTVTLAEPRSGIEVLTHNLPEAHRQGIWLGSLYAVGHATVVIILGVIAIVAAGFLPTWVDPVMEKLVGVTLIFLAVYLFYSVYRYYQGGGEFRMRSRWMLIFAGARNAWSWIRSRTGKHDHVHAAPQQYNARTAYGIGVIHGVGAETGTQALIIATAVGASSTGTSVAALLFFVVGLLISNTAVTVMSTVGFGSAQRRQVIYVAAGLVAAIFSLVVGIMFLFESTSLLPDLDPYFRWIGGPD
jgi:high-affinity nickel-transport protein